MRWTNGGCVRSTRFLCGVRGAAALLTGALWSVVTATVAQETPVFFRADQGRAVQDERALPERFEGAAPVWKSPLGPGHSTPCVYGESIYATTYENDRLQTVALDRATGAVKWSRPAPAGKIETYHPSGSPAAASPACDGRRVYVKFGSYGLIAYDLAGETVWSKPLGPFQDEFGAASSPVIVGDKLLLNEDHDVDSFLLCLDAATGRTLWRAAREGFTRSYSTPLVIERGGRQAVLVSGALQLAAYDLQTGKPLWTVDGFARIVNTTPAVDGDRLFVSTWSPGGDTDARISMPAWDVAVAKWDRNADGRLRRDELDDKDVLDRFFRIDLDQNMALDAAEWAKYARVFELARNALQALRLKDDPAQPPELLWTYDRGLPYVASPLAYRDVLYLVKDGGIVTALDQQTGKVLKQGRVRGGANYYASPVAGDGKLFLLSDRGELSVLRAAGDWQVVGSHDFQERAVATPVLVDGRVYLRTEKALYCYGR